MRRQQSLVVLLLAAVCLAQTADYRVDPRYQKSLPIEDLFTRIDARNDSWVGEQDYESIHEKLEETAKHLKQGLPTFPRLDELAARFRKLAVVQLKVVSSGRASLTDPTASIRIRVEIAREAKDGGRLSLQGH